ncbi:inositol monophosphatase [Xylona heveae TC161]|uniref:Inositol-1-monophosphatase n=1 Tax=Xylona heveae (strain CBS 132557 / TC161) TaxID=1328760 RepID=A0A165FNB6_XYLHT|nr:inositol monophosphatase [Xylona heveae TC161]KZF21185.1 inositol monophosphatase [Xylona heveae TC161]
MSAPNLQEIHDTLIEVAQKAGDMILNARPSFQSAGNKKNSVDLVTETDQAVEKMVSTTLREKYPDYSFLGEETYKPGMTLGSGPTFICDPIDGTTNFVHGHPYVSISLGFTIDKRPVVGVVYNPFRKDLFTAIEGKGAFLNRTTRLPYKQEPEPLEGLNNALVAVEWGSDRHGNNYDIKWNTYRKLAANKDNGGSMVHSLRSLGSAALNLCHVATGTFDAYWEAGCWAWDVAAGWVILKEAGGLIASANPGEWTPAVDGRKYFAVRGAPSGQKELVEELWAQVDGKFDYSA